MHHITLSPCHSLLTKPDPSGSPSEAQDQQVDETIGDKFNKFGDTVTELGQDIAVKTQDAFQRMQDSEFAVNTR